MDTFARETANERAVVIRETAARIGVTAIVIEKDFWVCWTLKRLFSLPAPGAGMIFKGGTSLSKGFGAIDRFSEDIDISLDRRDLGFGDDLKSWTKLSNKRRAAQFELLHATAETHVGGPLREKLTKAFVEALNHEGFMLEIDEIDPQTLNFTYPACLNVGDYKLDYIKPIVRLEFGARSDHWPAQFRSISPYINNCFPDFLSEPSCEVKLLSAERTFWEKATILHMLYHRGTDKPLANRMSRHYYDLARIAAMPIKSSALDDLGLLTKVAEHKNIFFKAAAAKYDEARPGSLRLTPNPDLEKVLRADYRDMSQMLFGPVVEFDDVLEVLADLETEINSLS